MISGIARAKQFVVFGGLALSLLLWAATVYRYNQERLAISG